MRRSRRRARGPLRAACRTEHSQQRESIAELRSERRMRRPRAGAPQAAHAAEEGPPGCRTSAAGCMHPAEQPEAIGPRVTRARCAADSLRRATRPDAPMTMIASASRPGVEPAVADRPQDDPDHQPCGRRQHESHGGRFYAVSAAGRSASTSARSLSPRPDRQTRSSSLPAVRERPGDRVRALERRDDPLEPRRSRERVERLVVGDRDVARAARCRAATRARGRCPGSRARPRSSAPRGSGRPRPA